MLTGVRIVREKVRSIIGGWTLKGLRNLLYEFGFDSTWKPLENLKKRNYSMSHFRSMINNIQSILVIV